MTRSMLVAAALFALSFPAAAVAQGPDVDDPPVVSETSKSTGTLTYLGGDVTVRADVFDDVGLNRVYVDVVGSDGSVQSVDMHPVSGVTYEATVTLPANSTPDAITYTFTVWAEDTNFAVAGDPAGETEVAGRPPFDEPPLVSDAAVTPTTLPATGGTVTIRAHATDTGGISEVHATITLPSGATTDVVLEPVSAADFEGTFAVPANAAATPAKYVVRVFALDDIGQESAADAGTVTVAGRTAGKASKLKAAPGHLDFGNVRPGRTKQIWVNIKHEGDKRAAPLALTLRTSGAPFSVLVDHVTVAAGKKVRVAVRYAPTAAGRHTGTLTIARGDGGPPLVVDLRGKAK